MSTLLHGLGRSLAESFDMLWATLWALVVGFGLSGAVQAFVSRQALRSRLGDHRPASVLRASFYGMASSSCSYAASAMTRSLFARGADWLASLVFMFASTNLVVELGVVLAVLIGWQFLAAEFVGGAVMIVLLVVLGSLWFRGRQIDAARLRASGDGQASQSSTGGCASGAHPDAEADADADARPFRQKVRSLGAWADAASYTMSDLTMLRKEMAFGFLAAGVLAAEVPNTFWSELFLKGHGWLTSVENALVGPLVALLSLVCSVGNVPLAAALWHGGIAFGGVVSFVFADLLTLPLLLIYRKQYGGAMALRMLGVFWVVMSAAGLATQAIFAASGLIPRSRPKVVAAGAFGLNLTTALDLVALAIFAGLFYLYRNQDRLGGGTGYARDLVCGMQVQVASAPASTLHQGRRYWFCSERCAERFEESPDRYLQAGQGEAPAGETTCHHPHAEPGPAAGQAADPVCGMSVDPGHPGAVLDLDGQRIYFCCSGCAEAYQAKASEGTHGNR